MSKSKTEQAIDRTLEFVLGSKPNEFFCFSEDVNDFYLFLTHKEEFFKLYYGNSHFLWGEICILRPNYFRRMLVNSLSSELNYIHTFVDVFKIVLCLEYLGLESESISKESVNCNKIICAEKLIEAASDESKYINQQQFQRLYTALSCVDNK